MWESFFGFKKTPFSDSPDAKQLFASAAWQQVKTRLEFLTQHPGAGLLTGEVGAGKSTAARVFTASLNPSLYKILYVHFATGSALDLLRQIALALDLEPAHFRGDLVRQISDAIVRLQPLLRRTLSLQMHAALRQRIGVHYHLEGLTREELDAYLTQQLKAAGVTQPLFDDTARQGLYQVTKGIPRRVNKLAMTALRLAAERKAQMVDEALLLDATAEALL
jgi:type II secretory pathway predicted ATPase ExeA